MTSPRLSLFALAGRLLCGLPSLVRFHAAPLCGASDAQPGALGRPRQRGARGVTGRHAGRAGPLLRRDAVRPSPPLRPAPPPPSRLVSACICALLFPERDLLARATSSSYQSRRTNSRGSCRRVRCRPRLAIGAARTRRTTVMAARAFSSCALLPLTTGHTPHAARCKKIPPPAIGGGAVTVFVRQ